MLHVKQILAQNSQKILDTMQRQNLRTIEIMEQKNKSISKEQKRHHKPNEPNRCLENALPKYKRLIFFSAPHGTFSKSDHSEMKQSSTVIRMLK